jgi:DNA-binding GntR family transcriptional regulator
VFTNQDQSLTTLAYNQLRHDILSCYYEPGSHLTQSFLTERYKLGKSPINTALQKLIQEGLVRSIPRVGYFVSSITVRDVNELYEALYIIEVNTARMAAINASDERLQQILAISDFSYVYKDQDSYFAYLEANKNFHKQIALASGNNLLVDILVRLLDDISRIFYLTLDSNGEPEVIRKEHHDLAVALCSRDIELVTKLSKQQILRSQKEIIEILLKRSPNQSNQSLQDIILGAQDQYQNILISNNGEE